MRRATWMTMLALSLAACSGGREDEATEGEPADTAAETPIPPEAEARLPRETDSVPPDLRRQAEAASEGMRWHFKPGWALFGPPRSEGVLTLRCVTGEGRVLVAHMASHETEVGATQTLRFQSERGGVTADLTARDSELGGGLWEGTPAAPDMLAGLFGDGGSDIVATMEGEQPLALPSDPEVAALISACAE